MSRDLAARIRSTLGATESVRGLAPAQRERLADDLHRVLGVLAEPRAEALDGPVADATDAQRVGDTFGALEDKIDFPAFVSKLVTGVFDSIVQSSINQMTAYQEMLESVAKSVEDFASDEIPDTDARSYLLNQCAGILTTSATGTLQKAPGASDDDLKAKLGYVPELNSQQNEQALVNKAKVRLAAQKQKLLATMVLMGINRIVITDGQINASIVFDVSAHDASTAQGQSTQQTQSKDQQQTTSTATRTIDTPGGSFDWPDQRIQSRMQVSTFKDTTTTDSADVIDAKAKLSGRVKINFKSETFPLEKFSPTALTQIMGVSRAPAAPTPATPPAGGKDA